MNYADEEDDDFRHVGTKHVLINLKGSVAFILSVASNEVMH